ncbi:MAG: DAK2 domain-containing protein [Bacillota bacterium]
MRNERIDGQSLKELLAAGTALLYERKDVVDSLNVFPVPDGDTGTNMYLTFAAAIREVEKLSAISIKTVVNAAASGALMGARGNSGVIISQMFRGFAKAVEEERDLGTYEIAKGLEGASRVAYQAVRKPVEGTILTIIREMAKKAAESARQGKDLYTFAQDVVQHAEMVLQRTPDMLPTLKEAGVVDAGGQGLLFVTQGAVAQLLGKPIASTVIPAVISERIITPGDNFTSEEEITFHYCTEFVVTGEKIDGDAIRAEIEPLGDCVLIVGDEHTTKVHVHTNNPGRVLEFVGSYGDLHDIFIHNMVDQARERRESMEKAEPAGARKEIGIVAVAVGDGFGEIFKGLGVDEIVEGGQTMNPSTEDLVHAVKRVHAKQVLILPNNGNVIMSANQVKELVDFPVAVVPSKFIPQGISALLVFNEAQSLAENLRGMSNAIKNVSTIEVTYAVRATQYNGFKIEEGDIIGLQNGEIITTGKEPDDVIIEALQSTVTDDSSLISVYFGADIQQEKAEALKEKIAAAFPSCETEVYRGGQPLYYYIASVE